MEWCSQVETSARHHQEFVYKVAQNSVLPWIIIWTSFTEKNRGSLWLNTDEIKETGEITPLPLSFLHVFIEQKISMEKRGWTAAVFLLVSFQLERNTQREYQKRLMVPVCCHLIVVMFAFGRYFVISLAIPCHFLCLSMCLLYLNSWGPSASVKEIRACNIFVS